MTEQEKIHMPKLSEIDEFCMKVKKGDISVEYETHYVEFDLLKDYTDSQKKEMIWRISLFKNVRRIRLHFFYFCCRM